MPASVFLVLAAFPAAGPARAQQDAATLCREQATSVERSRGLPPGLLLAVGRVESGRADAGSNDVLPWPWTVDDEGTDHVFNSAFDAIAYTVAARARGSQSLDVGCFQVNLQFHPDAFATLADAFDPATNARYAGQMLTEFHERTGSWATAVQWYHSATPWRGEMYRDRVLSHWAEASLGTPAAHPAAPTRLAIQRPTIPRLDIQVQTPASAPAGGARGRRLPRVIVPSIYAGR